MWLLLVACTGPAKVIIGADPAVAPTEPPSDETLETLETLTGTGPDDAPDPPDDDNDEEDDDRVFQIDEVHQVEITLDGAGVRALQVDPYAYVDADISWDGDVYEGVGLRIKGRLGSLRSLAGKSAFKLDLLQFGGTGRIEGLEKLNLNNMVQDNTQLKEFAAYSTYRAMGLVAPRLGYAWVKVNGDDFGLYSVVEDYDDEMLKHNFEDPSGNLYDGDYNLYPNGSYDLVDFLTATQDFMGLDEGIDVGHADVHAVTDAIAGSIGTPRFESDVGARVDLDWFARFWAVTAWIGQYDSYCYYSNNYRIYFDPVDGLARIMPWDPDWAFYPGTPLSSPYGVLAQACQADAACYARFKEALSEVTEAVAREGVITEIERANSLIDPWFTQDPRAEVAVGDRRYNQGELIQWYERRDAALTREFGLR